MLDEKELRLWWDLERRDNDGSGLITEIRIIDGYGKTYSGYFKCIDTLIEAIAPYEHCNIYYSLNLLSEGVYDRLQRDVIIAKPKNTTSDNDIAGRRIVAIDLDPKRSAGINATQKELDDAKVVARRVYRFLLDQGFNTPIVSESGNGVHIKIACRLANTAENTELVKNFLHAISMLFSTPEVDIDLSIHNPARILKCEGTYSRKGNTKSKDRPQRMARHLSYPDVLTPNDKAYFKKVADMLPKKEQPSRFNNYSNETFDLDAFISKHGIAVRSDSQVSGGRKIILDHCPFDSSHKGKDAMLFVRSDGAICFHCFHNSCSHYTWQDVRLLFDPQAYDKREYREFQHKRNYYNPPPKPKFEIAKEDAEKGKKWLNMSDIEYVDITKLVAIPTGYTGLDKDILGFLMGEITILSGLSGGGKSSWLGCIALNAVQRGYRVAMFSGELISYRLQNWLWQICAGKSNVRKKEGYNNLYYAPKPIGEKINKWLDEKLFIYNNAYSSKWEQLFNDIKECVEKNDIQLLILDNLLTIDITNFEGTQYNQQTAFINEIKEYAKLKSIHCIIVAHPRKDNGLLRKESIAGTADLTNLADNVIIIHRVGKDFDTRAKEFFGAEKTAELLMYDSVTEIVKNRSFGYVDKLYGMYYEQESRRLKNEISEHIVYGWEDTPVQNELGLGGSGLGDFVNAEFDIIDDDMSEPPF